MKKILAFVIALFAFLTIAVGVKAKGVSDSNGIPLYVIIEVDWDGVAQMGNWTVWGPVFEPVLGGTLLTSCTNCLEMNYDFTFKGNTVQFDETFVDTVQATPQVRHVVLHDKDGDGTYMGSLPAWHYFPWRAETDGSWAKLYFDSYDYELTFAEDGTLTHFHYVQYEHKKL